MVSTNAKTCSFDCVYCQLGAPDDLDQIKGYFFRIQECIHCIRSYKACCFTNGSAANRTAQAGSEAAMNNLGQALKLNRTLLNGSLVFV